MNTKPLDVCLQVPAKRWPSWVMTPLPLLSSVMVSPYCGSFQEPASEELCVAAAPLLALDDEELFALEDEELLVELEEELLVDDELELELE